MDWDLHALEAQIGALSHDRSLREPRELGRRIDALERLECWMLRADLMADASLAQRAEVLTAELEAINRHVYQTLRNDIRQGDGARVLHEWHATLRRIGDDEGYDALDELIGGVLQLGEPQDEAELEDEMVFYQPTPARHILDFIQRVPLNNRDVVIDLGSGLGHVTMLTAICTQARCVGVELQRSYVETATRSVHALGLRNAQFIAEDVRQARLSDGTVFYLYTPVTGAMLRTVLDRLKCEAQSRAIRVCTLGPCTTVVARESWLRADGEADHKRVALFQSR
ncbi:methyltransferase domain-containing protein [Dyella monticola]|nr:methyltransferase domain-containing protein [Dyella monticola]